MAKYDDQFKLAVVQLYLSGEGGYKTLCKIHGLTPLVLQSWVASFRVHGADDGLAKRAQVNYSAQFKLQVLEQMDSQALSDTQAIALHNLRHPGGISNGVASMMWLERARWSPDAEVDLPCYINICQNPFRKT